MMVRGAAAIWHNPTFPNFFYLTLYSTLKSLEIQDAPAKKTLLAEKLGCK